MKAFNIIISYHFYTPVFPAVVAMAVCVGITSSIKYHLANNSGSIQTL